MKALSSLYLVHIHVAVNQFALSPAQPDFTGKITSPLTASQRVMIKSDL